MAFTMEHQEKQEWCWNAVTVSVEHYFDPHSPLNQEDLAKKELGGPFNKPFFIQDALQNLHLLNGTTEASLSFADVKKQLDQNLPVCAHIQWAGSDLSHYVLITGYKVQPGGPNLVYVSDPYLREGNVWIWDYDAFSFAYSPKYAPFAEGTWVESFLIQQPPAK